MTDLLHFLEDFSKEGTVSSAAPSGAEAEDLEALRLDVFESGYKAGWDDAAKAQSDDKTRISSVFGQHLQDLSFTYHEAFAQVMNAVTPLLEDMVNVLLPAAARDGLTAHIVDQLSQQAHAIGRMNVVIVVAPSNQEALEQLLDGDFGFPLSVQVDDTLAEDQADIRFAETEIQIDLSEAVQATREAIQGFTHENKRNVAHGQRSEHR